VRLYQHECERKDLSKPTTLTCAVINKPNLEVTQGKIEIGRKLRLDLGKGLVTVLKVLVYFRPD
jgi:hypothetical protein